MSLVFESRSFVHLKQQRYQTCCGVHAGLLRLPRPRVSLSAHRAQVPDLSQGTADRHTCFGAMNENSPS